jgi:exosortase O
MEKNGLLKIVLLALWTFGHWSTVLWLVQISMKRPDALLIVIFLSVASGFSVYKAKIGNDLYVTKPALMLFFTATCGSIFNALTINFHQADLMFWLLGFYAWLGLNKDLWPKWLTAINIVILIAFAVPFYLEFSSGLGFGLRLLTASLVEQTLEIVGVDAISSQDIIITENAIAHVDIPCSGLKSLWVGSVFFLATLAMLNIRITLNTLLMYGAFIVLLLSANMFRVFILTVLISVYNLPKIADAVHAPIGILGFSISCGAAWFMLNRSKNTSIQQDLMPKALSDKKAKYSLCIILCLVCSQIVIIAWNVTPAAATSTTAQLVLPIALKGQSLPLTEGEKRYFSRSEQTIAKKWRFAFESHEGSILLVHSTDFNMFHAPELCMAANGVVVDRMETIQITPDRQVRVMALNNGQATGIYWLQSGKSMTDSFGERYWRYLWSNEKEWYMISIIINKPLAFRQDVVEKIIEPFYVAVSGKNYEITIVQ